MAYAKPGVTVKQVQTEVSPILETPNLVSCLIGPGYKVVETTDDVDTYTSAEFTTAITGYDDAAGTTVYLNVGSNNTLDPNAVYVDILAGGAWRHVPSTSWTASAVDDSVAIDASLTPTGRSEGVEPEPLEYDGGTIRVGYRALISGIDSVINYESLSNVEQNIGKITSYNPLAFGLKQAIINAGSSVMGYGVLSDNSAGHLLAIETLKLKEAYALAPLTHEDIHSSYETHVTSMSRDINKKERIVFLNRPWQWKDSSGNSTTTKAEFDAFQTATGLATTAASIQNKRAFYLNPDVVWITEERPVATVKQSYLKLPFSSSYDKIANYGLYAKFAESWTYDPKNVPANKTTYRVGDNITDAVYTRLMDQDYGFNDKQKIKVKVPVPGYYLSAVAAGMVSGQRPEQGFTNLPIAGDITELKYSGDYFTESQLNVMAAGGNWIYWQASDTSAIVSRHQMSTDRTSVEAQELNITKSLDFAAKFVRAGVEPYIGRNNITPAFLALIKSVATSQGTYLRREGYINDMKVALVEQDSISKDTINITLNISVQYPVNYIKVTLQF